MQKHYSFTFLPIILIIATLASQSCAQLKSERRPKIIEYIYLDKIQKSRSPEKQENAQNYVCKKMVKLRRVPLCLRLFDQPHYKNILKIKFNFQAYRNEKPDCISKPLSFRTLSMHDGIEQEMLLCPGRHDPLRSHWDLDDYKNVFYVSSGDDSTLGINETTSTSTGSATKGTTSAPKETNPALEGAEPTNEVTESAPSKTTKLITKRHVPDSLVVYKREWDADTDRYFIYEIIEDFKPSTLGHAIATEYDVEEDLQTLNAVTYNSNRAELEVIYILEMYKLLLPSWAGDAQLSRRDTMADLYESELATLCWVILDQPQYKDINFEPQAPPKDSNENAVIPEENIIRFKYSVKYNDESIKQTMYACKPEPKKRPIQEIVNANPKRIQISPGARPNSYFVYILYRAKGWGVYWVHQFVENLPLDRGTSIEKNLKITGQLELTSASLDESTSATLIEQTSASLDKSISASPAEHNTESAETQFIEEVPPNEETQDVICNKLKRDQLRTVCITLFEEDHYAKEVKIYFNYRLSLSRIEICQKRKITFVSTQLQTIEIYHRMAVCEGRHNPLRSDYQLDDYKDLLHVSQGPDTNSVSVFRKNTTADSEWFQVYDIVPMKDLENLPETPVTLSSIQHESRQSLIPSFNSNMSEIEIIYIREMITLIPPQDILAEQPESKIIALCYQILDREPYKSLNFKLSRVAFYAWRTRIKEYSVLFINSKEYNDEQIMQPMCPCYGQQAESKLEWRKDKYLHKYKISSGSRPNSFFLYSLIPTDNQLRTYTIHEFVENVRIQKLEPVEIEYEEIHKELKRPNSKEPLTQLKPNKQLKVDKPKRNKIENEEINKESKQVNTKKPITRPKPDESRKIEIDKSNMVKIENQENELEQLKTKKLVTQPKSDKPIKTVIENSKPVKNQSKEKRLVLKPVNSNQQITHQNPDKQTKTETEKSKLVKHKHEGIRKQVNSNGQISTSKTDKPKWR